MNGLSLLRSIDKQTFPAPLPGLPAPFSTGKAVGTPAARAASAGTDRKRILLDENGTTESSSADLVSIYNIAPRIVGGTEVSKDDGKFSSFAVASHEKFLCGATLIHDDILVTAAHCTGAFEPGTRIYVGGTDGSGDDAIAETRTELEYRYVTDTEDIDGAIDLDTLEADLLAGGYYIHDIMLVKLATNVVEESVDSREDQTIIPATWVRNDDTITEPGNIVTVIGHGATSENDGVPSNELLETSVTIIDFDTCIQLSGVLMAELPSFILDFIVSDDKRICTLGGDSSSDENNGACYGDSGGPMWTTNENDQQLLIGIVSIGTGECGEADKPAMYTRISYYDSWIRQSICDISSYPPEYCNSDVTATKSPSNTLVINGENSCEAGILPGIEMSLTIFTNCIGVCVVNIIRDIAELLGYVTGACPTN